MSWDLALRRHLPRDISRGDSPPPDPRAEIFSAAVSAGFLLAPVAIRLFEKPYYRLSRRGDLSTTQESPAITMRELVYGPEE